MRPLIPLEGIGGETHREQGSKEISQGTGKDLHDVRGWTDKEHEDKQKDGQKNIGLAQDLDALIQAGHTRDHKQDSDDGNDYQGELKGWGKMKDRTKAAGDLQCAEPQRGGDTKEGGEDRQDINDPSPETVYPLA